MLTLPDRPLLVSLPAAADRSVPEPARVEADLHRHLSDIIAAQTEIACADLDLAGMMKLVAQKAQHLTGAEGAVVEMAEGDFLVYRAATGMSAGSEGTRVPLQGSLSGASFRTGEVLRCDDTREDPRVHHEASLKLGIASMVAVPLRHDRKVVGVLKVVSSASFAFGRCSVETLQLVSTLLGVAIGRASDQEATQALMDERTAAQAALEKQSALLRNFYDSAPFLMSIIEWEGEDFRLLSANAALASTLFERSPSEVAGKLGADLGMPPHTIEEVRRVHEEALRTQQPVQWEFKLGEPGAERIMVSTVCVIPGTGTRRQFTAITQDVTEMLALRQRLDLSDRMATVGRLAAGVAHEANNPLAFVMSNLQFLAEEFADLQQLPDAKLRELLQVLKETREGASRVRAIVRDLYMFSRADAQTQKTVDLQDVLDKVVVMATPEMKYRAQLVRDRASIPFVSGNDARLGQVFLNLVVNAAQAIPLGDPEKQRIFVRTQVLADGRVEVQVQDTGSGIPPEILPRIFDPFFTTKPVGQGMGLGLSICHNIVRDHGGELTVQSTLGQGTTFRVRLPAI